MGSHVLDFLSWKPGSIPSFDRYLQAWVEAKPDGARITSVPAAQAGANTAFRLDDACERAYPVADFDLLSLALAAVPTLTTTSSRVAIAPQPSNLPETIDDLVAQVKADPSRPWSLTEAAALAGYSSFHFSRMFKQLVSCGFHEFVDRCRTEVALELLTNETRPLGAVSVEAGFPSLRAMRESIRDYLGLTVSELRGLAERAS
jgi:AraC-like DNA-binding protein